MSKCILISNWKVLINGLEMGDGKVCFLIRLPLFLVRAMKLCRIITALSHLCWLPAFFIVENPLAPNSFSGSLMTDREGMVSVARRREKGWQSKAWWQQSSINIEALLPTIYCWARIIIFLKFFFKKSCLPYSIFYCLDLCDGVLSWFLCQSQDFFLSVKLNHSAIWRLWCRINPHIGM